MDGYVPTQIIHGPGSGSPFPKVPGFVIVRALGRGGMSDTYLAHVEDNQNKQVVIKAELAEGDSTGFLANEAAVLEKLGHPGIIKLHPLPGNEGQWVGRTKVDGAAYSYILLKYMSGGSLQDRLNRPINPLAERSENDPLSLARIVDIMDQLAEAIDYAHSKDVLHLDLKPSNILFSLSGRRVVISDFGIAQTESVQEGIREGVIGTASYMAPERLDEGEFDARADIFSLGVILAEMLLGSTLDLAEHEFRIPTVTLGALPGVFRGIVLKATSGEPEQRYKTAASLVADLGRAQRRFELQRNLIKRARPLTKPSLWLGGIILLAADVLFGLWFLVTEVYTWLESLIRPPLALLTGFPAITVAVLVVLHAIAFWIYRRWREPAYAPVFYPPPMPLTPMPYPSPPPFAPAPIPSTPTSQKLAAETRPAPMPASLSPSERIPPKKVSDSLDSNPLASIIVLKGRQERIRYGLTGSRITIGRLHYNDIVFPDPTVSLEHAAISRQGDEFILYDLGSSNGTYVNSERVVQHVLQNEDQIVIGGTVLVFQHTEAYRTLQLFDSSWAEFIHAINRTDEERFQKASERISGLLADVLNLPRPPCVPCSDWRSIFMFDAGVIFAHLRFPDRLPVVFSADDAPAWDDIERLCHELKRAVETPVSHMLLVLPIEQVRDTDINPLLIAAQAHSFTLTIASRQEIKNVLLSHDSQRTLRRLVLAHTQLGGGFSPFVETGPATESMFFGRERELKDITARGISRSFGIIGGRRIGKTSILLHLHRFRLPEFGFRSIYHDCSTTTSYETFLSTAIRDWRPEPPPDTPITFGDLLQSPVDDKPLVLLLDEADKLVPVERANAWPLFSALRALANSGRARFVLSGERILREALRDPTSPLFNCADEMLIGRLDYRAVWELVTQPMKQLELEPVDEKEIVDSIWDFTSGHPNIVQRLCHRLIVQLGRGTSHITLDDVKAVVKDPGFQRDAFLNTYWEAATPLEKIISLLLATDDQVHTLPAIRGALDVRCNLHPTAREVDNALQCLVDLRSILSRTPTGYEFAVEAFPRVVAGTMTLDDMLDILTEEYQEHKE